MHERNTATGCFAAAIVLAAACAFVARAQAQQILVVDPPQLGSLWIEEVADALPGPGLPVKLVIGRRAACVNAAFLIEQDGRVGSFRILKSSIRGTPLAGEMKEIHEVAARWLVGRKFTPAPGNPQRNPVFTRNPTIVIVPEDRHYTREQEQALAAECDVGLLGGHLKGRYLPPETPEVPTVVSYSTHLGPTITVP